MWKKLILLIAVIFTSTIVCSAQVLLVGNDTLSCYTNKEVQKANKLIAAGERDSVKLQEKTIQVNALLNELDQKKSSIEDMEQIIIQKDIKIENRDAVIHSKDEELEDARKEIRKQKLLKIFGTGTFLATTIYFIIH